MDSLSRPTVMAAIGRSDQGCFLETLTKRIDIEGFPCEAIVDILQEARGRKTIEQLSSDMFSEEELIEFFDTLVEAGACFDAHLLSQYGHLVARYPDPLRIYPGDEMSRRLMQMPSDREGQAQDLIYAAVEFPLLNRRKTCRAFTKKPLRLDAISQIAYVAYAITETTSHFSRRTVPSAGAMYPLQHDYIVRQKSDIECGIYRWAKAKNALIRYSDISNQELANAFQDNDWMNAAVIQVIGYDIERSARKYASRAHRFALVEAGHSAQNSILRATELNVGSWEHGNYVDEKLCQLVELNQVTGGIATVILYGSTH